MNVHYSDDKSKLVVNHHTVKHSVVLISAVIAVYAVMTVLTMAQAVVDNVHDFKAARHAALK